MWPPLHTTKMYKLHKNRTYAYYKILIEPKKKNSHQKQTACLHMGM